MMNETSDEIDNYTSVYSNNSNNPGIVGATTTSTDYISSNNVLSSSPTSSSDSYLNPMMTGVASSVASSVVPSFLTGSSTFEQSTMNHRISTLTTKFKEFKETKLEQTRNWTQFIGQRNQYTIPSIMDTGSRIKENVVYFQTNYLILFLVFGAYFIITKPLFLFLLVLLASISIYIHYLNPTLPDLYKKVGYGFQLFLSIYFLLSAGSSIIWLIGATITIVLLHSALHVPTSMDDSTIKFGGGV
eukprot:gene3108-3886_t